MLFESLEGWHLSVFYCRYCVASLSMSWISLCFLFEAVFSKSVLCIMEDVMCV